MCLLSLCTSSLEKCLTKSFAHLFNGCCCCCSVIESCPTLCYPWTAAHQASLSFTISQSLLKFMCIELVMLSKHLIFFIPFSFSLQSFPTSGFFLSQLFTSRSQSIRASAWASILPTNIQGWFPLGLTGSISMLSKGLSRVFSSTTVWKHQFVSAQPSLRSNSHTHTWLLKKKHSFD